MPENRELLDFFDDLFGQLARDHLDALMKPKRPGLRINTLRIGVREGRDMLLERGFRLTPLPFYEPGFRVDYHPGEMGRSIEHAAGLIYIQEPSSMIPPVILGPQPGERVLDLAAAPGSKTTQMSALMENRGLILANDPDRQRLKALHGAIDRLGCLNVATCSVDGARIAKLYPSFFDRVLLDAPCSGIGTLHKNPEVMRWWSWERVAMLVRVQRRLILSAFDSLPPGGRLLYSTCTITPQENEGIIDYLLRERPNARAINIRIKGISLSPGLTEWEGKSFHPSITLTRRLYPLDEPDYEGFYFALIEKTP
ncbi:MAG: RsmB/NOP family class I SAM-dependent RNA methyltransferase [candidate division WOR-3 bacterium]